MRQLGAMEMIAPARDAGADNAIRMLGAPSAPHRHVRWTVRRATGIPFHALPVGIIVLTYLPYVLRYGSGEAAAATGWTWLKWGVFHVLLGLLLLSYAKACWTEAGVVPLGWAPAAGQESKWCGKCNAHKPPRAHHCGWCDRCTLNLDHHCPWINNCVGFYNRKFFIQVRQMLVLVLVLVLPLLPLLLLLLLLTLLLLLLLLIILLLPVPVLHRGHLLLGVRHLGLGFPGRGGDQGGARGGTLSTRRTARETRRGRSTCTRPRPRA